MSVTCVDFNPFAILHSVSWRICISKCKQTDMLLFVIFFCSPLNIVFLERKKIALKTKKACRMEEIK